VSLNLKLPLTTETAQIWEEVRSRSREGRSVPRTALASCEHVRDAPPAAARPSHSRPPHRQASSRAASGSGEARAQEWGRQAPVILDFDEEDFL
jgi:hypothetical protein